MPHSAGVALHRVLSQVSNAQLTKVKSQKGLSIIKASPHVSDTLLPELMALTMSLPGQHRLLRTGCDGRRPVSLAHRHVERTAIPARLAGRSVKSRLRRAQRVVAFGGDGSTRAESICKFRNAAWSR